MSVMSPRYFRAAVVAATLVGSLVRMYHIWGSDFPLNDGGMFLSMILDLQQLPSMAFVRQGKSGVSSRASAESPPILCLLASLLHRRAPW